MNAPTGAQSGFPAITVDSSNGPAGTDPTFDEPAARQAAAVLLK